MQTTEDFDKICTILDKLTLAALLLTEEEIKTKLHIENAMSLGESNLAKARYIMGQNKVSAIQLPTENTPEFTATVKVHQSESDKLFDNKSYEIQLNQKSFDETVQDPVKWFGVLVPQTLTQAQKMFRQALQWSVKAVNIQSELNETIKTINNLKDIKLQLACKKES